MNNLEKEMIYSIASTMRSCINISRGVFQTLSPTELYIYSFLSFRDIDDIPWIEYNDLVNDLNLTRRHITRTLKSLKNKKLIDRRVVLKKAQFAISNRRNVYD